jgi:hypothetical protein
MADKTRILVVANRTAMCGELRQAMLDRAGRGPVEFVLLVPATAHGASRAMDPYSEMGEATTQEERAMQAMREAGLDVVEGRVGDPDPLAAVEDELNLNGPYDEIIVSTLPTHLSKWLKLDLPHKVEGLTDKPVTHVIGQEVEAPA